MARYRIDPQRSQVWIDARSNVHPIHASTVGLEGFVELAFGPDGSLDLSVTPSGALSLAVSRLSSGRRMEDRELHKRIDAGRYPTIEGVLGRLEPDGDHGSYRVAGDVTFRGITRHYQERMTIEAVGERGVSLAGSMAFDIRDFDMEPPRVLVLRVEPVVTVRVDIRAEREG